MPRIGAGKGNPDDTETKLVNGFLGLADHSRSSGVLKWLKLQL